MLFAFVVCIIIDTENALAFVAIGMAMWSAAALTDVTTVGRQFGIGLRGHQTIVINRKHHRARNHNAVVVSTCVVKHITRAFTVRYVVPQLVRQHARVLVDGANLAIVLHRNTNRIAVEVSETSHAATVIRAGA